MEPDDRYEAWKQRRARAEVPVSFADRVLAAVREHEGRQRQHFLLQRLLLVLASSRVSKVAIGALACLTCVFRMMQVIGVFLFTNP
jgi:hypothetical protein